MCRDTNTSTLKAKCPPMSRAEVLDTKDKLLLIIHDKVYDATHWEDNHPGGHLTIRALQGKDATDSFMAMHPLPKTEKFLKSLYYCDLVDSDCKLTDKTTAAFRKLTAEMHEAKMFDTDYTYYYKKCTVYALMFATVFYGVLCREELWAHALSGLLLGLFYQQIAFIGHDLGHNGITHDRITDSYLGLFFGNFLTGIGIGWWKRGHNVHHIVTNSIEHDPDIQHMPIFAISPKFLEKPIFSSWYNDYLSFGPIAHVLVKYQHYLYYPVMAFARFNLYVQAMTHALGVGVYTRNEKLWRRDLQILTLFGFWSWNILLLTQLPDATHRLVFFLLAQNLAGILHIQITLSHFGMDTHNGRTYDGDQNGYLFTQLTGSMDIDCSTWMDWFHGGLQYQVVHHVWPRLPRHRLRKQADVLESFCKEHGLTYHHMGFIDANRKVLNTLRETALVTKSFSDLFHESFHLQG